MILSDLAKYLMTRNIARPLAETAELRVSNTVALYSGEAASF